MEIIAATAADSSRNNDDKNKNKNNRQKNKFDMNARQAESTNPNSDTYASFLSLFFKDIIDGLVTVIVTTTTIGRDLSGINYNVIIAQSSAVTLLYHQVYLFYVYFIYKRDKLANYENNGTSSNREHMVEIQGKEAASSKKQCSRLSGPFMTKYGIETTFDTTNGNI